MGHPPRLIVPAQIWVPHVSPLRHGLVRHNAVDATILTYASSGPTASLSARAEARFGLG